MPKLNEITKKVIANTSRMKDNMPQDLMDSTDSAEVCPVCKGKGYLYRDLPIHHPEFGKLDAYRMALSVIDEAVRNAVACGADPARIAAAGAAWLVPAPIA